LLQEVQLSGENVSDKKFDVFGIGNAIVDILAQVEDHVIGDLSLNKGSMSLMTTEQQGDILTAINDPSLTFAAGGSAANTMVAIAQSGGKAAYTGRVADDTNGEYYKKGMEAEGVLFYVPPAETGHEPTGSSVILTTPDAERTMCTHLGISTELDKSDVDFDLLADSKCVYVEGYLWSSDGPREACLEAFKHAKANGVLTSFTFSDSFLVDLFADQFRDLVRDHCDIVFCNADEARKLIGNDDLEHCVKEIGAMCGNSFITDGGNGSYVAINGNVAKVDGFKVDAVDTVGAGDAFAGGVLYGLTNGLSPEKSARWGNYLASRVVSKFGPRLDESIANEMQEAIA
jgi:sugar/nucleoside kinase (ribokinase family)